jgi:hypothetical protein
LITKSGEEAIMAVNKPVGDNGPQGAVKKRTQHKTTLGGASAWTGADEKRSAAGNLMERLAKTKPEPRKAK